MDELAAAAARRRWVQWEEVVVSNDRGRRLVHYYLRGAAAGGGGGGEARELAVVGRERSPRHMSYVVQGRFLRSLAAAGVGGGAPRKWRSRREVVDWLSSLVSGCNYGSSSMSNRFNGNPYDDIEFTDVAASKDVSHTSSVRNNSKEFTWLGPAWLCEKRWKHYRSFCRKGITISVHNFVYILSEEKKRLIAQVEDLYEDTNSTNVVMVRWFDKVDEVGVELPPDVGDREIFFSPGLQDLSVECIDGLAAVLSAQHFEKFQSSPKHSYWQPYICRRQIDEDGVKPFDVTQLQGYWSQEVRFKVTKGASSSDGAQKRKRDAFSETDPQQCVPSAAFGSDSPKNDLEHKTQKQLYPGSRAEVLSQDSGIRGCWFRCSVLKRRGDKIKVRYEDLQDADETGNLEEWVLLTRIAKPDQLGIRIPERPMVRPHHVHSKDPCSFDAGSIVDAWWNGGWWEGIVLQQGNDRRLQVYFPGEKQIADFCEDDLRHSREWAGGKWNSLGERKDITHLLPPTSVHEEGGLLSKPVSQEGNPSSKLESDKRCDDKSLGTKISHDQKHQKRVLADLTNALKFDNLKWRPRKRSRRSGSKRQSDTSSGSGSSSQGDMEESSPCGSFAVLNSAPDEETTLLYGFARFFSGELEADDRSSRAAAKWTAGFYCMTVRMSIDCNGCYQRIRRALLQMQDLDSHLIDRKQQRVSVCGAFVPQDVAIKLRKKTNRRVEILEIKEIDAGDGHRL
uniref:BAH domain-containing protein n=1 Tax=Oryza meridionalis TaxID=40149 RepID=A0A0E0ELS6_9ORYZ